MPATPVLIPTSVGYEGTVDEPDFSELMSAAGGRQYGVTNESSWKATAGPGDREVKLLAGAGFGYGVRDRTTAPVSLFLDAAASGSRWDLVVVRRDWQANESTFDVVEGSSAKMLPTRETDHSVQKDDQPVALVRVQAGRSDVAEIIDLRVWGGDGGSTAQDDLVLQFLNRLGTQVRIGVRQWARVLNSVGNPTWIDVAAGRLLNVVRVPFLDLPPSGQPNSEGVSVWGNQLQTIASFGFEDPGTPYRVEMYADGFWGNEIANSPGRHDFEFVVGSTTIANRLPAADEFFFGNWRSWAPPPSQQIFTGTQPLVMRARRQSGDTYGAVRASESRVIATIFSA